MQAPAPTPGEYVPAGHGRQVGGGEEEEEEEEMLKKVPGWQLLGHVGC